MRLFGEEVCLLCKFSKNKKEEATMSKCKIFRRIVWTLGLTLIFLVVSTFSVFAYVDCYIEPWGAPPWQTPDIWAGGSGPCLGGRNTLIARIHNIGTTPAPANTVFVKFYYAPYGMGYSPAAGHFKQIGVTLHNVAPLAASGGVWIVETDWDLYPVTEDNGGLWPPISTFDHFCVRVEIECTADTNLSNNAAQNNFTAVTCSECGFNFMIVNSNDEQANASLVTSDLPAGWKMNIKAPGIKNIREFTLAPNEAKLARLELSHPEDWSDMNRDIHVSLKLDGKLVGGITFRPVKSPAKKFRSLSFHAGSAIPIGAYSDHYNSGLSLFTDMDFHFKDNFSFVLLFGYNVFHARVPVVNDTHWWNLSANLKREITVSPRINIFLNVGPGIYIPHSGPVKAGANVGLGWNYAVAGDCRLEFGSDYHRIFNKSSNIEFIVTHVGVVFRY
jgi:hypothetical protein